MKKILLLSAFDLRGSGYLRIITPLGNGLVDRGYDVKAVGLEYAGNEHHNKFSLLPAPDMKTSLLTMQNLHALWKFDLLVVALDLPVQEKVLAAISTRDFPYIGIMPIESDPLCLSWSMALMQMNKPFIISQFGTNEAHDQGVEKAEHLLVGVDTDFWRRPDEEERKKIRKNVGIEEDEFIVLTVASNQERKNLSYAMKMFSLFSQGKKTRYTLVTIEHFIYGWNLRDLAQHPSYMINDKLEIHERGMPDEVLWNLYASADLFLLPSKAEGLGMPLLEAMSVGVPCVGTDCTAIAELLGDSRGELIPIEFIYKYDPFGNGKRYYASPEAGAKILDRLYEDEERRREMSEAGRKYVEERKWDVAVGQLDSAIKELLDEDNNDS